MSAYLVGSSASPDSEFDSYVRSIVQKFPGHLYRCKHDPQWTMVGLEGQVESLTGFEEDELLENRVRAYADLIHPEDQDRIQDELEAAVNRDETFDLEYRLRTRDDEWRWVWNQGRSLDSDDEGTRYLEGFIQDITERKQTELNLQEALQEREDLQRELHHRVKNDLQFITSLINLKKREYSEESLIRDYEDLQNRVQSMALMHEMVSEESTLTDLDARDYFTRVTQTVLESVQPASLDLDLELDVEPMGLDAGVLLPGGLILNELINNAVQHGFEGREEGRLSIALDALEEGRLALAVEDDGTGLDEDQALFDDSSALGLRIVKNLVENRLQGEWEVEGADGLSVRIEFHPSDEDNPMIDEED